MHDDIMTETAPHMRLIVMSAAGRCSLYDRQHCVQSRSCSNRISVRTATGPLRAMYEMSLETKATIWTLALVPDAA
jgi:hypothetical protein